ncbi:MAG: Response regulator of zinc sigma-54-dependent two-component system [Candidatus Jettenia ecosi]|uniref:Response regulator of zinc sigma-54-dependent two-component system n=1 Tax=Candidatus Jettenia ecosi TaxID=2494326 RepID=A0A533Q7Q6_9BACT|nr:MAG: Response regulator of zinc sigma-54-dependent two-component system [Candidatus Jettenia ecosi]
MIKRNSSIVIVVITAYSSAKTAVDARRCGVDEYLTKPINIEKLEL